MARKKQNHNTGICTIYLITNKNNGKVYVGQTWRLLKHRAGKKGQGYRNCAFLWNSIQKHGWESFESVELYQTKEQQKADRVETLMIEEFGSRDHSKGYNLKTGGNSKGKHSEATKKKISESVKKIEWSEEAKINKRKFIGWWKGKKMPEKTDEQRTAHSERMKVRHKKFTHPMKGKKHTEEARKKISLAGIGRKRDPESARIGGLKRRVDPQIEALVIIDCNERILSLKDIAQKHGIGSATVGRIVKRNGLQREPLPSPRFKGRKTSEKTKIKQSVARSEYWARKRQEKKE